MIFLYVLVGHVIFNLKFNYSLICNLMASSVIFISHGAGASPFFKGSGHEKMVSCLRQMTEHLIRPKAIIVISAHWEATQATIGSGAHPELIYDYTGFPEAAYQIKYPAPGNPKLAKRVFDLLEVAGIKSKLDSERGFDHGMFVPLKIMYPNANIPCIEVSLIKSLDAQAHIKLGKALASLKDEDVVILGSGFSFHNMRAFLTTPTHSSQARNLAFEAWLNDTLTSTSCTEAQREKLLTQWEKVPAARYCHPREEHLLPLHVCYGAAGTPAKQVFSFDILSKMVSCFLW